MSYPSTKDIELKLMSLKMMKVRGYNLGFEETLLDKSIQEIQNYYHRNAHLVTNEMENRVYYNPLQSKESKIILPGVCKNNQKYINFPLLLLKCLNLKQDLEPKQLLSNIYYHPEEDVWTMVYFTSVSSGKLGQNEYRAINYVALMCDIPQIIFITKHQPTPQVMTNFNEPIIEGNITINVKRRWAQLFYEYELLLDIMNHIYVPKYTLVSSESRSEAYVIDLHVSKGRQMKSTDPVAKYMGWHPGYILLEETDLEIPGIMVIKEATYIVIVLGENGK